LGEEGGVNLYGFVGNNPVNWIDFFGQKTVGFGIGGQAGFFGFAGGSVGIVVDDWNQIGIAVTGELGAMAGASASLAGQFSISDADNIQQLGGKGVVGGISAGEGIVGGGEYFGGQGYNGVNISGGVGVGTPAEGHAGVSGTKVWCLFNCHKTPPKMPKKPSSYCETEN